MTAKLRETFGKLGGALRANRMVKVATHMIAARYETKLRLLFRMGRTSDMCAPHYDWMILPPFWLASSKLFFTPTVPGDKFRAFRRIIATPALSGSRRKLLLPNYACFAPGKIASG